MIPASRRLGMYGLRGWNILQLDGCVYVYSKFLLPPTYPLPPSLSPLLLTLKDWEFLCPASETAAGNSLAMDLAPPD